MYDSENFQVMNYGLGGTISLHVDEENIHSHTREGFNPINTRIMTFMTYLSDVTVGGNTVFPQIDLSVKPTKGSALFWFNISPSMHFDSRLLHLGCPVVYGNKWIVNKWVNLYAQFNSYKCSENVNAYSIHH